MRLSSLALIAASMLSLGLSQNVKAEEYWNPFACVKLNDTNSQVTPDELVIRTPEGSPRIAFSLESLRTTLSALEGTRGANPENNCRNLEGAQMTSVCLRSDSVEIMYSWDAEALKYCLPELQARIQKKKSDSALVQTSSVVSRFQSEKAEADQTKCLTLNSSNSYVTEDSLEITYLGEFAAVAIPRSDVQDILRDLARIKAGAAQPICGALQSAPEMSVCVSARTVDFIWLGEFGRLSVCTDGLLRRLSGR